MSASGWAPPAPPPRPTPVDLLANQLLGPDEEEDRELPEPVHRDVRAALADAVAPALERPPCLVSFSGGRDSSAILAVALETARGRGLPEPVPAILRFPRAPESEEGPWQQAVLDHLGVARREVVELHEELDALGPVATTALLRDGVTWPANAYMHEPILELARGGSLLTGIGGDELLGTTASRHILVMRGRARPRARDLPSAVLAAMPRRLRAAAWRARAAPGLPWLTSEGAALLARAASEDEVAAPHRWDRAVGHWYRSRAHAALSRSLPWLARDSDVVVANPFMAPAVLAALGRAGGPTGFPSRTEAMRRLFGDLLPPRVLARGTKAQFSGAVWGPSTRSFAEGWDGAGLDGRYVDPLALRREWLSEQPNFQTSLLLHTAWLRGQAERDPSRTSSS